MFDDFGKTLPMISLAAFALFSIFNIGYFWNIGIHFLGIVDLSNLVYSFGLALTFLFIFVQVAALVMPRDESKTSLSITALIGGAIVIYATFGERSAFGNEVIQNVILLFGMAISASGLGGWWWIRYKQGSSTIGFFAPLTIVVFGTVFQAGIFTDALEMIDRKTYSVITTTGSINDARILRSSSVGFIISADRKIIFLPHSQIKELRANAQIPE
jgi:hypothetical protein